MKIGRDRTKRRGTAITEAALILPFLLILILGGVDFGFQLYVVHTMSYAAGKAARKLALHQDMEQARSTANDQLKGFDATFAVKVSDPDAPPPSDPNDPLHCDPNDVVVYISVPQDDVALGIYGLLGLRPGGTLDVKAIMRKEY